MTVGPAAVEAEEAAPKKKMLSFTYPFKETELAIVAGILAVVITIFTGLPAVIKGIGMLLCLVWGADSVRKTSKYGLGTGVPSIGLIGIGYGIVGALMGLAVASIGSTALFGGVYPAVLLGVIVMGGIGYVSGYFSNKEKWLAMKIPRLERAMAELGMAGTLVMLIEISIITGSLDFTEVVRWVMNTGVIAFMFILSAMGMFHPYNASLGPDERRERTLTVSLEISGLICVILGFSMLVLGTSPWGIWDPLSLIIFGLVDWVYFYRRFITACMKECYATVGTGLIKTID
jgi:tetrahydromethanopterin S-methyltransferase subunit C